MSKKEISCLVSLVLPFDGGREGARMCMRAREGVLQTSGNLEKEKEGKG